MTGSMRTFIALELCNAHKAILKNIQARLKTLDADVKWVEPELCHITLKFLGSTNRDQIKSIITIMDKLANSTVCFPVELEGIGAFPTIDRPQIIWAGIAQGRNPVTELSNHLDHELFQIGFPKEKREFFPHITIGRNRSPQTDRALSTALKTISISSQPETIEHITLFESVLSSDGPLYAALHRSPLKIK